MEDVLRQQQQQIAELQAAVQQMAQASINQSAVNTELQKKLAEATAAASSSRFRPESVLDPKIIGRVKPFDGQRSSWKTWEFHWKAYLVSQDRAYQKFFQGIDADETEMENDLMTEHEKAMSTQLYFMLVMAMPEDSVGEMIMRNAPTGEGAAAWKRLQK